MLLLCALMAGSVSVWADDIESVTFSEQGYGNGDAVKAYSGTDFKVTFSNAKYYTSGSAIRAYSSSTITVSSTTKTIEKIVITFGSSDGTNTITTDVGTYSSGTWTGSATSITFSIGGSSGNRRIATIAVTFVSASKVLTPTFSPAAGAVVSGTDVEISCATDGATIHYTTDSSTPTSSSATYSSAITITAATTIKAIAIKDGLTDSDVASASYTVAEPCATPTFSVAAGEVNKGTTVTISTGTADATIYYTTNGTTPTTSSSVYSSALTINTAQTINAIAAKAGMANSAVASAAYTVRDYATLPVDFNSGKNDLPTGFKGEGLGTDYSSGTAPTTQLKFDGTDDNLILKFNSAPGELKFDIKGNGFSGGTFKVQYSADGSSYTDLKSYTSLGDTQTETFRSIPATTRYIRWYYTSKSSGNVGLGNIKLTGCESVTVSNVDYATYASTNALDFTNSSINAYIAKANGTTGVTFKQVDKVPANTGVLLYKSGGATEYIPIMTGSTDDVTGNVFVKGTGAAVVSVDGEMHNYILNNVGGVVGFYKAAGQTVAANRAYIQIDESATVKEFITLPGFENDDADGIETVDNRQPTTDNIPIYNLAGQRISKMQKGINIINGKKVLR